MKKLLATLVLLGLVMAGCGDDETTRPPVPPAAPRGMFSITGDGNVTLVWLANTESDVVGYRIYEAPCASGGGPTSRPGWWTSTCGTIPTTPT